VDREGWSELPDEPIDEPPGESEAGQSLGVTRDLAEEPPGVVRDVADEATGALRDAPPDIFSPIDADSPISGHRPPAQPAGSGASAPEHDWSAARGRVFPLLRPAGVEGTPVDEARSVSLADSLANTQPLVDGGPAGLTVVYGLAAEGFAILVNAEHLLSWGVDGPELRDAAMANLAAWSADAEWSDESTDERRLLSSSVGEGYDAARILLPEVRARIAALAGDAPGTRVLVGLPERDLLVAGALRPGDDEFAALFAEFLAEQSAAATLPIDTRVFELRGSELVDFTS
jgi:hypothetical protein